MFSDFRLVNFSEKLMTVRHDLGYTRQMVSELTGINPDTLRKIEKGKCVPRFETIEILSHLYKIDLIKLLSHYKSNPTLSYFYESIDSYIVNNDVHLLLQIHKAFKAWNTPSHTASIINRSELIQLEQFLDALIYRYSVQNCDLHIAMERLIASIQISIPNFSLSQWKASHYSPLELRHLYCIASFLIDNKQYVESKDILSYLIEKYHMTLTEKSEEINMLIKFYALMSYNCHMLGEHTQALNAANLGIELCQKHSIMENLPLLLSRTGLALMKLKSDVYPLYFTQAVNLLEIQNNFEQAKVYRDVYKKYGVHL